MKKTIKRSLRGLTFSFDENETFKIGTSYRYIIDKNKEQIIILPEQSGKLKISKKKSGQRVKPLFDLRSKEVKKLVQESSYLEVEIDKEQIVVHTFKKHKSAFSILSRGLHPIEDILNAKHSGSIILSNADFKMVVGDSYFSDNIPGNIVTTDSTYSHIQKSSFDNKIKSVYKVISLFSGCGLFDLPFYRDNAFKLLYGIDYNKAAVETYKANIGNHIVHGDVTLLDGNSLPKCDIILGSPPCKAHSNANRRTRLKEHPDVDLIDSYIRIVKETGVNIFVIENVPTFITACDGEYLQRILDGLSDYEIVPHIVHDGSCQGYTERKRCIIIGSRIGKITLPDLKVTTYKTVREALAKVDATWYNYNDTSKSSPETLVRMSMVRPGHNYRDIPELCHLNSHSNRYRRLNLDSLAPTLLNWRKAPLIHPTEIRTLSVAEAAALSGLDKTFKVLGTLDEKQQQIGNAVPYGIGSFIMKSIKHFLNNYYKNKSLDAITL